MKTNPIINEMKGKHQPELKPKGVYQPTESMRKNKLSKKPSNNVVRVVFEGYETLFDNVHHTNAYVSKIKNGNQIDDILEIWVNTTKVYWKKNPPTTHEADDLPF